ncbi:uncharacterized protein MONBRDRAFT_12630 [Monosiga brevicollis MX1]|uniref:DNA-directed RNA polymerase subunit beta n=1 Tax=Monosiga brevicollis TaxID=81824 RepID=A9VCU6_MONBE|nr:uncharacterized protein MONBRDRAFT_12630 [Monosiga brevicollis MX1]EDQ84628.1 predicted protein [Monosiga brevicollis MX1]|eukprot:XP_001750532.1 hypothetical protein [Monosiga brevicollis MX1]
MFNSNAFQLRQPMGGVTANPFHESCTAPADPAKTAATAIKGRKLKTATAPHVDSFNYMVKHGLEQAVADLDPLTFVAQNKTISLSIAKCRLEQPTVSRKEGFSTANALYPAECRQRRVTYKGDFYLTVNIEVEGQPNAWQVERYVGQLPIMIMSNACRLNGLSPRELVMKKEEAQEMGGYFIINGNEKIVRMLLMPRRNHPICLDRPSYVNRGPGYSSYGVQMRCVRPDQSAQTVVVHYKNDGTCTLGFSYRKQQYLIPAILLLRALSGVSDRQIFMDIVRGDMSNSFLVERVEIMLRQYTRERLFSQQACLAYLGNLFKVILNLHPETSDVEAAHILFKRVLLVHIAPNDFQAKYRVLVGLIRRVYSLAAGSTQPDNADSQMLQELLLPGHIYCAFVKEQMSEYLVAMQKLVQTDLRMGKTVDVSNTNYLQTDVMRRCPDIGSKLEYFMSTGNLNSPTALDQMQVTGFTIVADKLNFLRYLSHFRCVHRGAYFSQMKTTAVRKLLPEAWGFLCPVHTPDGAPCGLLNHLARHCLPPTEPVDISSLPPTLLGLGMIAVSEQPHFHCLDVLLDGHLVGFLALEQAPKFAEQLRILKIRDDERVPNTLEIAYVAPRAAGQFPGLYLFSTPARLLRPVRNLRMKSTEFVGSFEQVYLNVAVDPKEFVSGETTHMELTKHGFLSIVASFTPFSDFNQSPRNMYQCQMGKQTMGVPGQAIKYRADNKLYSLNSGQTPLVRPRAYNEYGVDNFPVGNNAIVCVIAYTGYDMEDAMILNKGSVERGFMHARVLATKVIDLTEKTKSRVCHYYFGVLPKDRSANLKMEKLDADGLPRVGAHIKEGDALYSYIDGSTNESRTEIYRGEPAIIDRKVTIRLSINRNPIIGDKFASRHGQKGILSQLWPTADMPFSESGIIPDILFNPHGFPSRMTIGMLIESMAGKSAALHGVAHDATPFMFNENERAVDYFGEQLRTAGYNYHGHERMYSGITGEEFEVDIFIGNVFYQRLRHMVSDKFQVRTQGPVNSLTRQPVKGRKKNGGIRFGEMERDALLGHGTAFLLQDRLFNCSDRSEVDVCRKCGSLLSPYSSEKTAANRIRVLRCRGCSDGGEVVRVNLPYVFRYLTAELSAMNIRLSLDVAPIVA